MKLREYRQVGLPWMGGRFREILLLLLEEDGREVWTEAAPLPGWSEESLGEVEGYLRAGGDLPGPYPSLRWAWEMAEAELGGWKDFPLRWSRLPINALLSGRAAGVKEQAGKAYAEGCRCFKIKTMELGDDELVDVIQGLELEKRGVSWRIDANRSWDFSRTLEMTEALQGCAVEYFEEPLRESAELPALIRGGVPVALDETLREVEPEGLGDFEGAVALVLKPTLMGGLRRCREFIQAGQSLGMRSVISSCYEAGLGTYALARLAASLPEESAAGLDPYWTLGGDVLEPRWQRKNWRFEFSGLAAQSRLIISANPPSSFHV